MTRKWMRALAVLLAIFLLPCGALAEVIEEMLEPPVEEMTFELDGEIPTSEILAVEPEIVDSASPACANRGTSAAFMICVATSTTMGR